MKKIKEKLDNTEIIKGLIVSVLLLFVIVIGYATQKKQSLVWAVQFVIQLCVATIWWIAKQGFFSVTKKGFKNIQKSFAKTKSTSEKQINKNLSGIVLMYIIGVIELLIYLSITYV